MRFKTHTIFAGLILSLLVLDMAGCSLGEPPATPTPMPTATPDYSEATARYIQAIQGWDYEIRVQGAILHNLIDNIDIDEVDIDQLEENLKEIGLRLIDLSTEVGNYEPPPKYDHNFKHIFLETAALTDVSDPVSDMHWEAGYATFSHKLDIVKLKQFMSDFDSGYAKWQEKVKAITDDQPNESSIFSASPTGIRILDAVTPSAFTASPLPATPTTEVAGTSENQQNSTLVTELLSAGMGVYKAEKVGDVVIVGMDVLNMMEGQLQFVGVLNRVLQSSESYSAVIITPRFPSGIFGIEYTYSRTTIERGEWIDNPENIYVLADSSK